MRNRGETKADCKHGLHPDWCNICTGSAKMTVSIERDQSKVCNVWACRVEAKRRFGPVVVCASHFREMEISVAWRGFHGLPDDHTERDEWVYFVQIDKHIKIGHSTNLKNRIRSFASYGHSVEVLGIEWGDRALEAKLHRRFRDHRAEVGLSKEMFEPTPVLLRYIESGRKCAYCDNRARPDRAVCGVHNGDKWDIPDEEMIGYAVAHDDTLSRT